MSMNKPTKKVSRVITTDNLFTDSAELKGYFNCSISGIWEGTITIQRSFDKGTTWHDVKTFVSNGEEYGFEPENGVLYMAGVKAGEFTSGAVTVRLSQ